MPWLVFQNTGSLVPLRVPPKKAIQDSDSAGRLQSQGLEERFVVCVVTQMLHGMGIFT